MKVAVLQFPGSNCDQDALYSLRDDVGIQAEYVWHKSHSLAGFDAVFIPGGFTYGDYLRCGAIASRAPIMDEVKKFAMEGRPVIGVCNGFQILCESGLLPGALMANAERRFICQDVYLAAENRKSLWTAGVDRVIRIPIAHGEGRYICTDEELMRIEGEGLVAFRYVAPDGSPDPAWNVNGSMDAIAGVLNPGMNVLGLMPHPERATREILGCTDGLTILRGLTLVRA